MCSALSLSATAAALCTAGMVTWSPQIRISVCCCMAAGMLFRINVPTGISGQCTNGVAGSGAQLCNADTLFHSDSATLRSLPTGYTPGQVVDTDDCVRLLPAAGSGGNGVASMQSTAGG